MVLWKENFRHASKYIQVYLLPSKVLWRGKDAKIWSLKQIFVYKYILITFRWHLLEVKVTTMPWRCISCLFCIHLLEQCACLPKMLLTLNWFEDVTSYFPVSDVTLAYIAIVLLLEKPFVLIFLGSISCTSRVYLCTWTLCCY